MHDNGETHWWAAGLCDEKEARRQWMESRRQAARFFESAEDMKWLYFDLALKGAFDNFSTERNLSELVCGAVFASQTGQQDGITKGAASYVDCVVFHCTALRDFFILRLLENMSKLVQLDTVQKKKGQSEGWLAFGVVATGLILWTFVNWWTAGLALTPLVLVGAHKLKANDRRILAGFQMHAIEGLIEKIKRGGFDEKTIIEQLEMIDLKKASHPGRLVVGNTPIPFGEVRPLDVPDVLYALLRLPRRNLQSEISSRVFALDKRKREEIEQRWRKFVDAMLKKG